MWHVSAERWGRVGGGGTQLGDLLRRSGGGPRPPPPLTPPVGPEQSRCRLNTLRQCLHLGLCPSLCPSERRVPLRLDE